MSFKKRLEEKKKKYISSMTVIPPSITEENDSIKTLNYEEKDH